MLSSDLVAASISVDFGGGDLKSQADKIQGFLFGPVMRFVAVLGCGYGFLISMLGQSYKPLLTFGAVGLGTAIGPKFIEGVFGMLIQ